MNIGIITVHDASNLGSYLQALGMQEIVSENGDTPYIIETRSHFDTFCRYMGYDTVKQNRSLKSFLAFSLRMLYHPRSTFQSYKKYIAYKRDWEKFKKIIPARKCRDILMDVLLLGSDEIWNMNYAVFKNPLLYGIGLDVNRKIAYAISCGNAETKTLQEHMGLVDGISQLEAVLARDNHTQIVLQECGITTDARICDPTLQIDIRKYMKSMREVEIPQRPYMVVYAYSVSEKHREMITRFAKENGLLTVAVSLPQTWCDEYFNCSPLEFGAILEGAEYVFTSTFHGTIFSALYHKKFVSLSLRPKVKDVLKLLGIEERELLADADYDQFAESIMQVYDFAAMEARILKLRKESQMLYRKYVHEEAIDGNM